MSKKSEILILIDDRGFFYSSTREMGGTMNVSRIKSFLEDLGYHVRIKKFYEINFLESYKDKIIIYQSTEDPDLKYKDYIEDILLGLEISGAILIPDFKKFRVHHNKVFMEVLREIYSLNEESKIITNKYGTFEEFKENITSNVFPFLIKPGIGSRSKNIYKVENEKEAYKKAKIVSRSLSFTNLKRFLGTIFKGGGYKKISNYRNKFITQNYISGFSGDYKILVYGEKVYVLKRENRKNDFRASGSGVFSFPENLNDDLLNYSLELFNKFKVPYALFDIAEKDGKFHLLEFQFVSFGQYTLEKSNFYFKKLNNVWEMKKEKSDLEKVFAESIDRFIKLYIS